MLHDSENWNEKSATKHETMTVERTGKSLADKMERFLVLWEVCDIVRIAVDENNKPQFEVDCEHVPLAQGQDKSSLCFATYTQRMESNGRY